MATANVTIADNADDGYADNSSLVSSTGVVTGVGLRGFLRFTGVTVPAGSAVTSATLTLRATGSYADLSTTLRAQAVDDASRPASASDLNGRTATSASVAWHPATWPNNSNVSPPDLATVVQEVINRPGWSSGNALMFLWESSSSGYLETRGGPPYSTLSVTYTDAPPARTATAAQTLPPVTQAATVTVTVPAFTATVAQSLPAVSQAAEGVAAAPFTVTATVTGGSVDLSWPARIGSGYAVERDGSIIAFGLTGTTYTDSPGEGEHTYRIGVLA